MRPAASLALAWRFLRREWRSGELTVLALALVIAVAAMSSVAFFADRVERGLAREAGHLLAADLVVSANAPLPPALAAEAARLGLAQAVTITFPSMTSAAGQVTLTSVKAVSAAYPLRGRVTLADAAGRQHSAAQSPAPGQVWADARLLSRLGLQVGDKVGVGARELVIGAELVREPDGALDLYNFVPRLVLSEADLAALALLGDGSRARYRLLLAGEAAQIERYRSWLAPRLPAGARLESVEEARPEIKAALERARRFLGMTAMLTVALSAAAVAMAVRRFLARHWQTVAVLRCLGLPSAAVGWLFAGLFVLLALFAGLLGVGVGYAVQWLLVDMLGSLSGESLPAAGPAGAGLGLLAALVLALGLALPPILALRQLTAASVLRNEVVLPRSGLLAPALAIAALLLLSAWQLGDGTLAMWLLLALAGFFVVASLLAAALLALIRRLSRHRTSFVWRYGVANLARRPWLALVQIVALSVGLMALLVLTVVRADLVGAWQASVPQDAPNKFVINLQAEQRAPFAARFAAAKLAAPDTFPMTRARLLSIAGKAVDPARYQDERARRLAEREFNLSWSAALPDGNQLLAGAWWQHDAAPQFSVEAGLAQTLGIRLGDMLVFDIAGTPYQARVTSLRKVSWDSFRPNFFVLAPPGWFSAEPASYIGSFYLPAAREALVGQLVAAFPNLTVIDVGAVIAEVRSIIDRLARAVELMFALALSAGVLVLWATFSATRHERLADMALMRALGASRTQLRRVLLSELLFIGLMTGVLAALGAMATGGLLAARLLSLPFSINVWLLPGGALLGVLVVLAAGWPLLRRVAEVPPLQVLRAEL